MNCPKCGKEVGNSRFCPECGADMSMGSAYVGAQEEKQKRKKPALKIVIVVIFAVAIVSAILGQNSGGAVNDVEPVFDAMRFVVEDESGTRPMNRDEVQGVLGEPDEVKEWDYSYNGANYPVVSLSYQGTDYVYNFYQDQLARIEVYVPTKFESEGEITALYNLKGGSVITDTEAAYRVENCGVHDLWCTYGSEEGVIDFAYISYTNFFENPYDPVMEGDGQRPPDLQLLDYDSTSDGYFSYVVGHVINNSSKTYSYVQVTVGLYNGDVLVGSTLDNVNNLAPGSTWEFKAIITDDRANQFKIEEVTGW